MTTTYDPATADRLIAEAREQCAKTSDHGYGVRAKTMRELADQLEAAGRERDTLLKARIDGATGLDNDVVLMLRGERDDARRKLEAAVAERDDARRQLVTVDALVQGLLDLAGDP